MTPLYTYGRLLDKLSLLELAKLAASKGDQMFAECDYTGAAHYWNLAAACVLQADKE